MRDNSDTVVLVADDEPSTLALVVEHVRARGFKVIEASDGDMAWQLAHQHLPDLVILDVMMPGMSGWEVCRKIRESLPLAHTGVIMLTGIGQNLNEMTSPLYGADTHVDKPFEFVDLDAKIDATLKERRKGTFGRADHADEVEVEVAEPRPTPPPFSGDDAPLTAPTGGRIVAKSKKDPEAGTKGRSAPPAAKTTKSKAKKSATTKAATKTPAKKVAKAAAKPASKKAAKKAVSKSGTNKKLGAKKAPVKKAAAKKAPAKGKAKGASMKPAAKSKKVAKKR